MAKILHLFRAPKRHALMEELATATAVENSGLEGCAHARPGSKRQVLLVDVETLGSSHLVPGIIRENITTQGLDVNTLQTAQTRRMGSVLLEVSAACEPCEQLEAIRPGLQQELQGQRGMLCRVLTSGTLQRGGATILQAARSAPQSEWHLRALVSAAVWALLEGDFCPRPVFPSRSALPAEQSTGTCRPRP